MPRRNSLRRLREEPLRMLSGKSRSKSSSYNVFYKDRCNTQ